MSGRLPPHDDEAERVLLSAVLLDPEVFWQVHTLLTAECFYAEAHRLIFAAVVALQARGSAVDHVTVAAWLRSEGKLDAAGGTATLHDLTLVTPAFANAAEHALTVRDRWRQRQLLHTLERRATEAYDERLSVQAFADEVEADVFQIASDRGVEATSQLVREACAEAAEKLEFAHDNPGALAGLPTGLSDLDGHVSGLHDGDLTYVAGRPGMGKSTLALGFAARVARPDASGTSAGSVAVFSLEMPRDQVALKLAAAEARVNVSEARAGGLDKHTRARLLEALGVVSSWPMLVDDTPAVTLLHIRGACRRYAASERRAGRQLRLVVVDYLQLMKGRKGATNREQEIGEISRGLKELAKELECPVVALSQLNRECEKRPDKRPRASDLRDSGSIEQDADMILLVYRHEVYFDDENERGKAEVIIGKFRHGPTGTIAVQFHGAQSRFSDLVSAEEQFSDEVTSDFLDGDDFPGSWGGDA